MTGDVSYERQPPEDALHQTGKIDLRVEVYRRIHVKREGKHQQDGKHAHDGKCGATRGQKGKFERIAPGQTLQKGKKSHVIRAATKVKTHTPRRKAEHVNEGRK